MKKKLHLLTVYNHLEELILVCMFAVMVIVIFVQVIMRFVFNNSLSWSEALARLLFVWLTWLGVSIGAREGEHIKITAITEKLPRKVAQIVNHFRNCSDRDLRGHDPLRRPAVRYAVGTEGGGRSPSYQPGLGIRGGPRGLRTADLP